MIPSFLPPHFSPSKDLTILASSFLAYQNIWLFTPVSFNRAKFAKFSLSDPCSQLSSATKIAVAVMGLRIDRSISCLLCVFLLSTDLGVIDGWLIMSSLFNPCFLLLVAPLFHHSLTSSFIRVHRVQITHSALGTQLYHWSTRKPHTFTYHSWTSREVKSRLSSSKCLLQLLPQWGLLD